MTQPAKQQKKTPLKDWAEKYPLVVSYHNNNCQQGHDIQLESGQKLTSEDSNIVFYIQPNIREDWTVINIVQHCTPIGWGQPFSSAIPELLQIDNLLQADEKIYGPYYPRKEHLFQAFAMCPLTSIKVVIVGQDPYPSTRSNGLPVAQGMSFSIPRDVRVTSSLRNIYAELKRSIPGFVAPNHGDLSEWANQGVLLLNSTLTIRPGDKNHSHKGWWDGFIRKVLKAINDANPYTIYMLWGRPAQAIKKLMSGKGVILEAFHPSGMAASTGHKFVGCNHFAMANDILSRIGKTPINWQLSP